MKKILTFALIVLATAANAQTENNPTEKGNWVLGGSTSFHFNTVQPVIKSEGLSVDGTKTTNFTVTPSFGYFVIDNLAIGMDLELSTHTIKAEASVTSSEEYKNTAFSAIPSVTYYFSTDSRAFPYIGAGAGYASVKSMYGNVETQNDNFFVWRVKGGISYLITNDVSVDLGLNYNQLSTKINDTNPEQKIIAKNFGATLGFSIFLD